MGTWERHECLITREYEVSLWNVVALDSSLKYHIPLALIRDIFNSHSAITSGALTWQIIYMPYQLWDGT